MAGIEGEAIAVEADVSDPEQIEAVATRAQEAFGGTDILVNNAAIYPIGPWHEADAAEWDAVFATNVRGYFLLAKAVRPQMLARGGGSIVNVASVTFYWGEAGLVSYVASKGAVIGFTRSLAREAGPEGIRVNAVAPGAFPTAATAIHDDQDALSEGVLAAQSIKRRGEVEDVARAIAFFAGDDSGFVSGQTLLVDGGWMRGSPVSSGLAARRSGRPAASGAGTRRAAGHEPRSHVSGARAGAPQRLRGPQAWRPAAKVPTSAARAVPTRRAERSQGGRVVAALQPQRDEELDGRDQGDRDAPREREPNTPSPPRRCRARRRRARRRGR